MAAGETSAFGVGVAVTWDRDTLGNAKSGDALQAVEWWRAGQKDRVAEYCEQDVAILRDVIEHAREGIRCYFLAASSRLLGLAGTPEP